MEKESSIPILQDSSVSGDQYDEPTTTHKILYTIPIVATVATFILSFVINKAERDRLTTVVLIKKTDGTIRVVVMNPNGTVKTDPNGTIDTEIAPFQHKDLELIKPDSTNEPFSAAFINDDFIDLTQSHVYNYKEEPISDLLTFWSIFSTIFIIVSMIAYHKYAKHWFYSVWHISLSVALLLGYIVLLIVTTTEKSSRSRRKIFSAILGILSFLIALPMIGYLLYAALLGFSMFSD